MTNNEFWHGEAGRDAVSFGAEGLCLEGDRETGSPLGPKTQSGLSAKRAHLETLTERNRIGTLLSGPNGIRGPMSGCIHTPEIAAHLQLVLTAKSLTPDAPTYHVFRQTSAGYWMRAGSGWLRTQVRGDGAGQSIISLSLDGAKGPRSVNVLAVPEARGADFMIVRRTRQS